MLFARLHFTSSKFTLFIKIGKYNFSFIDLQQRKSRKHTQ